MGRALAKTTKEFIQKARSVHGNVYDYGKTVYTGSMATVKIKCPEHGVFYKQAYAHIGRGQGCPTCAKTDPTKNRAKEFTLGTFIEQSKGHHGDFYDYSKVVYLGNSAKVEIICPEHGSFWQYPKYHRTGSGCRKCGDAATEYDTASWVKAAKSVHGDSYDYSKAVFTKVVDKVEIICPQHGSFWQRAYAHIQGRGCCICGKDRVAKALAGKPTYNLKNSQIVRVQGKAFYVDSSAELAVLNWLIFDKMVCATRLSDQSNLPAIPYTYIDEFGKIKRSIHKPDFGIQDKRILIEVKSPYTAGLTELLVYTRPAYVMWRQLQKKALAAIALGFDYRVLICTGRSSKKSSAVPRGGSVRKLPENWLTMTHKEIRLWYTEL